ncbi:alpha/beta hydrolase family protein [Paraliomyxa miuraensis]|uniref:alpha/beta hydrolase family protein n=1 Tax=Paraliomyxa miuraensis TaxID=376150 RepID=UPI0022548D25|nr:alpha/beta fold hydrolase [Paraliomyxa miuraensis]MCX4244821.1 alpha/beta fold hydrolase [Paraliomyxa miuraensis]
MGDSFDIGIPTRDDRILGAVRHEPRGPVRAQVVIHGATAVHQRYYGSFARHLAWRGFRVLTYDYRGIGRSRQEPLGRETVTMAGWIDDATAAQRWLVDREPELPLLAIGHGFGGQIAPALDAGAPRAVLQVGSGAGFWRGHPPARQPGRWLTWALLIPGLSRAFGYVPGWTGLSEDLPAGVARQWSRWCRSPDYFLSELPWIRERLAAYEGRVLALSFSDDAFAPPAAVEWMLARLERAAVEHRHLRPEQVGLTEVGHFGAFRATAIERLWPEAVQFLTDAAELPTGATRWPSAASRELLEVMADLQYGRP